MDSVAKRRTGQLMFRWRPRPRRQYGHYGEVSEFWTCHPVWPSSISAWPGAEIRPLLRSYLGLRAGGTPTNASNATANAISRPRASAPPSAARTRPPTPASFGSFEIPATQPHPASRFSRTSGSQRFNPRPNTSNVPTARKGPQRRGRPHTLVHRDRAAVRDRAIDRRTVIALL